MRGHQKNVVFETRDVSQRYHSSNLYYIHIYNINLMKIIKVHKSYILSSSTPWRALQGAKIREFKTLA
ncbi:hypothetical protein MC28_G275 (plasmid) [Bacillus thuringiensis MC28]|nr:hypothetical protein MC28_G275 [Bacillus thuringiensis MC28]